MSYTALHHTNHTAQLSIKPTLKSAQKIRAAVRHNERIGNEGRGHHIDERRQFMNKDLIENSQNEIYVNLINRITGKNYTKENVPIYGEDDIYYKDGKKLRVAKDRTNTRYDTVLAFEVEAMYPGDMIWSKFDKDGKVVPLPEDTKIDVAEIGRKGEIVRDPEGRPILDEKGKEIIGKGYFKMPYNKKEFDEWCKATVEFAKDKFGEKNVVSAKLHMDEQTPHMHLICTPIMKNKNGMERLNYYDMLGRESVFGNIQQEYAKAISYIGYKAPERNSQRIYQISTKEYKVRLSNEMRKDMPKDLNLAQDEIRNLRMRNFDLTERMREIKVSANKFQSMRNKLDKKREEIKKLEQELEEKNKILESQKEYIFLEENKKRCIEKGLSTYEDEEVSKAYKDMELTFLKQGYEKLISMGIDKDQLQYRGVIKQETNIDIDKNLDK